jgi:hypothetical protein
VHARVGFLGLVDGFTNYCSSNPGPYLKFVSTDHDNTGTSVMEVNLGRAYADGAWSGARVKAIALSGEWLNKECDTATMTLSTS